MFDFRCWIKSKDSLSNSENLIVNDICQQLKLYEGYNFHSDLSFTAENVSYDRKFSFDNNPAEKYYFTTCLPFTISKKEISGVAFIGRLDSFGGDIIEFKSSDTLIANEPCIIRVTTEKPFENLSNVNAKIEASTGCKRTVNAQVTSQARTITMTGIYSKYVGKIKSELINFALGYSEGSLAVLESGITVSPFRAVVNVNKDQIVTTNPSNIALAFEDDEITRIETEKGNTEEKINVYTLNGTCLRKDVCAANALEGLPKGIYIIGKKKIIIK